ncbi:LamG-like jellyroll fold domain-containing protein [Amycolatopsis suaedae]|uniref:LamG domain-containing protein n=1 Tax=Amycolatopsis suaedae TaxID=2510978 RepID=A0A4V2ELP6_9PSEU|nr:LamG-like jellyroll fold domain-containing protein [Amycolatopsis suaedae]RZQ62295.1 LamG domain-containing protein [Amycolatopsis suaedae]
MRRGRRLGLAGLLALALLVPPPAIPPRPGQPVLPVDPVAAARESGAPVEVTALRSEYADVFANPSGTFTRRQYAVPRRARTATGWAPIDTTLREHAGAVVAGATVPGLRLSTGGDGPLLRMTSDGRQFEVDWPAPLPRPVLDGATATYPGLLPGADLRLTALPDGVRTEWLGTVPATARFTVRATGTTPRVEDGSTLVADGFVSAGDGPAGDGWVAANPTRHWMTNWGGWTSVMKEEPHQAYWNGSGLGSDTRARAGYSNWPSSEAGRRNVTFRSYFQFNLTGMAGKDIVHAEVNVFAAYAPSCQPRRVRMIETQQVGVGTNWNSMPAEEADLGYHDVAYGWPGSTDPNCGGRFIGFTATGAVAHAVRTDPYLTTMLRADNESDPYAWKKFDVPNAHVAVEYNTPPDAPGAMLVEHDTPCAVQPNEPYVGSDSPVLRASVSDPDGGAVAAQFEWRTRGAPNPLGEFTTPMQQSGSQHTAAIPRGLFGDGGRIGWRVRAFDGRTHGPWSGFCDITVDRTPPDKAALVSSATHPPGEIGGPVGTPGTFTFDAAGVTDVSGFTYGLVDVEDHKVTAVGGKATVTVTPTSDAPQTLFVRSIDRAGHRGPEAVYRFRANGRLEPPVRHWRADGRHPERIVPDSGARRRDLVFAEREATWTPGRHGDALRFDGGGGHAEAGPGSGVDTSRTFSVSAWVRLDRLDGTWRTAVSQDGGLPGDAGNRASGFYLQYRSDTRQWAFTVPSANKDNFGDDRVSASVPVVAGAWTHLVGMHDPSRGRILLYVNGALAGEKAFTTPWRAEGGVQLGRARFNGAPVDFWDGAVDDVRIYDRLLIDTPVGGSGTPSEIDELAGRPAAEAGRWSFDEGAGAVASDSAGRYLDATLSGASWAPGKNSPHSARFDGVDDHASATGPAVRTDGAFTVSAWVRPAALGTVPMTAVGQDGVFRLGYDAATRRWAFTVDTGSATVRAASTQAPVTGEWVRLTGIHNPATRVIELYVGGQLTAWASVPALTDAAGPLRVGRASSGEYWNGWVDEVRVHTGVRSLDELSTEINNPELDKPLVHSGLNRYLGHDGEHRTAGPQRVPPGYRLEHSLGWFAPPGAPGTAPLYSCQVGPADQFSSLDPNCEGYRRLAELGPVYRTPPADEPTIEVYRCVTTGGEHFESRDPSCEGQRREFLLGHTRAYAQLFRHLQEGFPHDHVSSLGHAPGDYRPELALGVVSLVPRPGTVPLYACRSGTDEFTSADARCEGRYRELGWVWTAPPTEGESRPLVRCRVTGSGERFDLDSEFCAGQTHDQTLGHLLLRP